MLGLMDEKIWHMDGRLFQCILMKYFENQTELSRGEVAGS